MIQPSPEFNTTTNAVLTYYYLIKTYQSYHVQSITAQQCYCNNTTKSFQVYFKSSLFHVWFFPEKRLTVKVLDKTLFIFLNFYTRKWNLLCPKIANMLSTALTGQFTTHFYSKSTLSFLYLSDFHLVRTLLSTCSLMRRLHHICFALIPFTCSMTFTITSHSYTFQLTHIF